MTENLQIQPVDIQHKIHTIRNQKVMLDFDLAELYGVETKRLKEAVRRNNTRFPDDFMFELEVQEWKNLRSQIASSSWGVYTRSQFVTLNKGEKTNRGQNKKYLPYVFTEQGIAMLSAVLRSETAVRTSIQINLNNRTTGF
jgi:hypothetical protein